MGTSKSSPGSPSGVPLVPPWVPEVTLPPSETAESPGAENIEPEGSLNSKTAPDVPTGMPPVFNPKLDTTSPIASGGRFRAARGDLGRFSRSGESRSLKRGISHYTKSGLGGKKQATRRFAGTANTAGALFGALTSLSGAGTISGQTASLDRKLLEGKSADDVIGAIIEATRPLDGTQDAESSRASINDALVDLLEKHPEVDLLNLDNDKKEFVIEKFVACDIFRRFILDVGGAISSKAANASVASQRLKEARDYIRETVAASFKQIRSSGKRIGQANINAIARDLLEDSFRVFEEYIG